MHQITPYPFTNWGDWLIQRSTGLLGDFRMPFCISIIRTEKSLMGWVNQLMHEDIRRILARYKEHVTYWNTRPEIIQSELAQFADALGWAYQTIVSIFNEVAARRFPPELGYDQGSPHWSS